VSVGNACVAASVITDVESLLSGDTAKRMGDMLFGSNPIGLRIAVNTVLVFNLIQNNTEISIE
jgi:hypothetical protein